MSIRGAGRGRRRRRKERGMEESRGRWRAGPQSDRQKTQGRSLASRSGRGFCGQSETLLLWLICNMVV